VGVIAVVGGAGFLGRHVTVALERAGHVVRSFSRRTGFDALKADPEAFRGCDAVINLAGIKREAGSQTFQAVHVDLVARLVEAMRRSGVRRLLHVSVVVARADPRLPYHDTKWKGEEIVRSSGLDWTILRPGVIYGEGDDLLSHLALMIRAFPVFPIVNDGLAPMRPVDACDVASVAVAALRSSTSFGKTYDVVGPDRLTLRAVVSRVAEALGLPLSIWPTPVALMRIPVRLMESVMRHPLSTRAQLAMLVEGLDGDPDPARRDLGVGAAPFTAERLRPLLERIRRRVPFDARLLSAPKPARETPSILFWVLLSFTTSAVAFVFRHAPDAWTGMTASMGLALAGALASGSVRRRLWPTGFGIAAGLAAGAILYGLTGVAVLLLRSGWPGWEVHARLLYALRGAHGCLFVAPSLVLIVLAEEAVWRGVIARFLMERWGRASGIAAGAAIYALAHAATLNPLLVAAALGCGLFWGILYAATDSLVAPFVSHLVWDILLLFVIPIVR
jgi:uncharacterized protein YbjT (DUF2867 family)/membrane protease YdiL (CAAX protease family)